ncbi:MAG TPA: YfiR family protein, partial [Pseudomonadales bacterium]|nr:YfiR family protein [Pseudomonadales bacterium]
NVEAAYLSNFGKFVEWPQKVFVPDDAPIVIGIYGESPFHDSLDDIVRNRIINGHQVIARAVSLNTLQNCQVLFICPSEQKNLPAIIRKLDHACVLTVTENINPFQSGAMINFVRIENQIRFEINDAAARRAGLRLSSKLLSLATKTTMSNKTPKQQALICERSP